MPAASNKQYFGVSDRWVVALSYFSETVKSSTWFLQQFCAASVFGSHISERATTYDTLSKWTILALQALYVHGTFQRWKISNRGDSCSKNSGNFRSTDRCCGSSHTFIDRNSIRTVCILAETIPSQIKLPHTVLCAVIKKKRKFSSYIRKFRGERLQSHKYCLLEYD